MSTAIISVPQRPRPYNLRVYLLGQAREGVFLRNVVCRSPKKEHQKNSPPDVKQPKPERVARSEERTEDQRLGSEGISSTERGGISSREAAPGAVQAAKRAKTRLRRLVEANNLSTMFSLTFDTNIEAKVRTRDVKGNLADWQLARHYFALFKKRFKRYCVKKKLDCKLVAVSELQKRGVQHFHVATSLRLSHADLLALWGYGTVWVSEGRAARRRDTKNPGTEASYVARYIGKYLAKDMVSEGGQAAAEEAERVSGASRYHRSRSLQLPFEEHLLEAGDMSAFQQVLEEDGFKLSCEPVAIEKDGINFGWWARSVQMAVESGDLIGGVPAACGGAPPSSRPSHLTDGQLMTKPKNKEQKEEKKEKKEKEKLLSTALIEAAIVPNGRQDVPKRAVGRWAWVKKEETDERCFIR